MAHCVDILNRSICLPPLLSEIYPSLCQADTKMPYFFNRFYIGEVSTGKGVGVGLTLRWLRMLLQGSLTDREGSVQLTSLYELVCIS
jgi:hypothetical protein